MDTKPRVASGYDAEQLDACRRVLVEFCRGLGPWTGAVYLVGGLAPSIRNLTLPDNVPPHLGTLDIDLFLDTTVMQDVEAYHSLKRNIQRMGLQRGHNDGGVVQLYRWEYTGDDGRVVSIDLLCDAPSGRPGTAVPLPGESGLSALVIPASSLAISDHVRRRVVVKDRVTDVDLDEDIQVAGISASLVMKALAFEQRPDGKEKDAYDMVWSLMAHPYGPAAAGREFADRAANELDSNHHVESLAIIRRRFADDDRGSGARKEGPTRYAAFLTEEQSGTAFDTRRQQAASVVAQFIHAADDVMAAK